MGKLEARKTSRRNTASGYRHHSYDNEKLELHYLLNTSTAAPLREVDIATYADVLAPTPMRGMKNGAICMITLLSRTAIDSGVPAEESFSISDYYVYHVELQETQQELQAFLYDMVEHFRELVRQYSAHQYSLPVARAVRYIHEHVYGECRVQEVAAFVKRNPNYLSGLFRKEVGMPPSDYILHKKVEEAKLLFSQFSYSIGEISDMLGFCNPGYFATGFRKVEGISPREYLKAQQNKPSELSGDNVSIL